MDSKHLYSGFCEKLKHSGKYRKLPEASTLESKEILDFSTNDYLNLSHSPELIQAAYRAAERFGIGSTGSRLLSGNNRLFEELEAQIARDKKTESALIFNSGYQANISVLASLLDPSVLKNQAVVFFDKLNHASLYQGVFLSGAELVRYHHCDMDHLGNMLLKYQNDSRPKFIVSETLYGMDGDLAPLGQLAHLAEHYGTFLYLDEAHATGVFGPHGYGLSTTVQIDAISHIVMGTFSKGLGACGAYIACSQAIKDYLINKCPGFIYSTSLSPMVIGAVTYAWNKVRKLESERHDLLNRAKWLRLKIQELGLDTGLSATHIIPIILGKEEDALKAQLFLREQEILVSAIRPPTVPPGTSRLRIALTLKHQDQDLLRLLNALGLLKN